MTPAGLEKIAAAKKHGTWSKLDHVESFAIPAELEKAFKANPVAKSYFDTLSNTNRKMMLYHINNAKREETRAKRVADIITAMNNKKLPDRYYTAAQLAKRKEAEKKNS
jgi:uncharacterized protein YdeI (YjbR/CyaY-like superfamily)